MNNEEAKQAIEDARDKERLKESIQRTIDVAQQEAVDQQMHD